MDQKELAGGIGLMLIGVGLPVLFHLPTWVAALLVLAGIALSIHAGSEWILEPGPSVKNFEVPSALNFRVTNKRVKNGLSDDILLLHSIKLWNAGRRQFQSVDPLGEDGSLIRLPIILTNDQPGLPYRVPRMFQLVQFTNKSEPFIQGYVGSDMKYVKYLLPCRGIWDLSMELRWAGGSRQLKRVVEWGEHSLPTFRRSPS